MRALLAAFAIGVLALPQQAELPRMANLGWVVLAVVAALVALIVAPVSSGSCERIAGALAILCAAAAFGVGGFQYAAWRAQDRLADELPSAWEGRDIDLFGVVDELPQSTDRGPRFAFSVERIDTLGAVVPSRLSLG